MGLNERPCPSSKLIKSIVLGKNAEIPSTYSHVAKSRGYAILLLGLTTVKVIRS